MSMFYEGYSKDREKVFQMNDDQLYDLLDALFGRGNLPENPTHEQLQSEALAQHKREWTDERSPEFERVEFYKKLYKVMKETQL